MAFLQAQLQNFALAGAGVISTATSVILKSFETIDGVPLTMSDFGSVGYGTLEPGNGTSEESISFTGVTQNTNGTATLTGVKTVLFISPYTETSGLAKTHPGSSVFVISNTAGYYEKFGHLDNDDAITGFWTAPDPLSTQGVATKNYVDNLVNGGTVTTNALIEVGVAGETVAAGNPVYLKAADGRWWKAIGTTAATVDVIQLGIAQGAGTAGVNITGGVLRRGVDTHQSGGVAGSIGYISNTTTIATSAGTVERAVGNFLTATTFDFDPAYYYVPTASQKAAMQGGGAFGTPSGSNKFATETYITSKLKFGGTGADGALAVTSGTTSIDLAGAQLVIKNYTSISITATGGINFTNPHANGTVVILKSQGDITLTSSTAPMIDNRNTGALGGTTVTRASNGTTNGTDGNQGFSYGFLVTDGGNAGTGSGGAVSAAATFGWSGGIAALSEIVGKYVKIFVGSGGASGAVTWANVGGGTGTSGIGGRGGGALILECGGALNFTTASGVSVSGTVGGNGVLTGGTDGCAGGGGGGGGGFCMVLYNTLTAASGTITSAGGVGGNQDNVASNSSAGGGSGGGSILASSAGTTSATDGAKTGGDGAIGVSLIAANTEYS